MNIQNLSRRLFSLKNPLYMSSLYIMLASTSTAGIGFLFWVIAAKIYPSEEIGVSTVLISSLTMLTLMSMLGFDQSIVRFFQVMDKNKVYSTSMITTIAISFVLALLFFMGSPIWLPDIQMGYGFVCLFIVFLIAHVVVKNTGMSFVALRRPDHYFYQSLILGSKIAFLPALLFMGALGIFTSIGISALITALISIVILTNFGLKTKSFDRSVIVESFDFSMGNYFAGILIMAPSQILPIIILNILGPKEVAYYFMSYALASFLLMIPSAFSTSLFVEGCHGVNLRQNVVSSLKSSYLLLIPAIALLNIFAEHLLLFIGSEYVGGLYLLRVMTISSVFITICYLIISIKKVQNDVKGLLYINITIFTLLIAFSYLFLHYFGIVGIGYAWVLAYLIPSIIFSLALLKNDSMRSSQYSPDHDTTCQVDQSHE